MTEFLESRLVDCKNIKECNLLTKSWNKEFQSKAKRSLSHLKATQDDIDKINSLFGDNKSPRSPIMSNRYVRGKAQNVFYRALVKVRKENPDAEFAWVTIISSEWETSDENTILDILSIGSQARRTLSAISPNYVSIIETSAFSNAKAPGGGKVLSPHVHSIIWGKDVHRIAREIETTHASRFGLSFTDAPTIMIKQVGDDEADLARLASYCFKPPHRCKNLYQSKDGTKKNLHEGTKTDRYIRFLRLAQIYSLLTIDKIVFASGDGSQVRSAVLKGVKAKVALKTVCGNELIHRDAIPNYWTEMLPRLNESRFLLPFIKTRK